MKLLVALGNPGAEYELTRHNVGFILADQLCHEFSVQVSTKKFNALIGRGSIAGTSMWVCKPQTFMNLSGRAVAGISRFYKIDPKDIVVIHVDIDMEFGKIKIRRGGGHGGHNGIRSMIQELGDDGFSRIKIGVGRPAQGKSTVSSWVLERIPDQELVEVGGPIYEALLERLRQII